MSHRAVMTTATLGGRISVYVHADRVEVGSMDPTFTERLSRVAYRDARRMVVWSAQRPGVRWVAAAVLGIGVLLLGAATLTSSDGTVAGVIAIVGATTALLSVPLFVSGRRGAITRFRIEGVRGNVTGALSGRMRKRTAILAEIERHIRERQRPQSS